MDEHFHKLPAFPGFRLSKMEVFNWGTFDSSDGQVYTVRPNGRATLLVGLNGSGKSTLVDAILTLLVPQNIRNYNVAAGTTGKRERNESSYVKGAYGHGSSEESNRAQTRYLRTGYQFYSCLLAHFVNSGSQKEFTIAQVLVPGTDEKIHKVFCFSEQERSIADHLNGIQGTAQLRKKIIRKGWEASPHFAEYSKRIRTYAGMQEKAMDVFNQTVAVKDIRSLNDFIRAHMLEKPDCGHQIKGILGHFADLSEAYNSLVDIRDQRDLLLPVAKFGESFNEQSKRLTELQALKAAAEAYFVLRTLKLLRPLFNEVSDQLQRIRTTIQQLKEEIGRADSDITKLTNDIENAGGDRLKEIPNLIKLHETERSHKERAFNEFGETLKSAELRPEISDADSFVAKRKELNELQSRLKPEFRRFDDEVTNLAIELREATKQKENLERERNALKQRRTNMDESLVELRAEICRNLGLQEASLPYAAELISVKQEHREWESSIEMVLRSFGLSLLVPKEHYRQVSNYVERTRLANNRNEGQRLVYLKVESDVTTSHESLILPNSLLNKINLKSNHSLLPWLQIQLEQRFNYTCCETMDEFRSAKEFAMTKERHVKTSSVYHVKDDRTKQVDPGRYVLGWDNKAKIQHLEMRIKDFGSTVHQLTEKRDRKKGALGRINRRLHAIEQALKFNSYEQIDYRSEALTIYRLKKEKEELEQADDSIRVLKTELKRAVERKAKLNDDRDDSLRQEARLKDTRDNLEQRLANASSAWTKFEASGELTIHQGYFSRLDTEYPKGTLTPENLNQAEQNFNRDNYEQIEMARKELDPIRANLEQSMGRFLRKFAQFERDMKPQSEYLGSFLDRLEKIESEGLPHHEKRFKERLNEKVTHEIGLLNGNLQTEQGRIRNKIAILNQALKNVEFNPGTVMRLEPRDVFDREITEFKQQLSECISGGFEDSLEANEARFKRIEKLIRRLGEEERWRNKVSDVRRWFDFIARELDQESGDERSSYSDSAGQSGGQKAKLAFTILVAAIAYQYDIDPAADESDRFHFVMVDEMFSKIDDHFAEYALDLFASFGLQLLIVAPLDAKARVAERYVQYYVQTMIDPNTSKSEVLTMNSREFKELTDKTGS